jgi:hypothetical protein
VPDRDFHHCSNCRSTKTTPSRVRWYERWRTRIGMAPYRCHDCNKRFWREALADF